MPHFFCPACTFECQNRGTWQRHFETPRHRNASRLQRNEAVVSLVLGGNIYIERPDGGVQNTRANALETRGGRPESRALAHEANALAFLNRQQRTRAEEVERVAREIHRANPERFPGLPVPPPEPVSEEENEEAEARRLDHRDREDDALHLAALH